MNRICGMFPNQPKKFYLTFGLENHKFKGGWAEVWANSKEQALSLYAVANNLVFNCLTDLCCSIYDTEEWSKTIYAETGKNFNKGCMQVVGLYAADMSAAPKVEV